MAAARRQAPWAPVATAIVMVTALIAALWMPKAVDAHVAYDGYGRFIHQYHDREFTIWNQIDNSTWAANARDAQLQLHSIYNGSLRFPTASSSTSADIVMVDAYYADEFAGRAYNWAYHNGQGRLQMNTRYALTGWQAQGVVCHELSHFTGVQHSYDATDCMHAVTVEMQSAQLAASHRDQMRTAWTNTGH